MIRIPLPAAARDRRAVVWGSAVVAGCLVLRLMVPVVRSVRALEERANATASQLAAARALIAAAPLLRDSLAGRGAALVAQAPLFVDGRTEAEAQAELAGAVTTAAAKHRVRVTRQEPRPDTTSGAFPRAVMRFDAEGDVAGVVGWLGELESGQRVLDVVQLSIDAPSFAAPSTQPEALHVGVTISGVRSSGGR